MKYFATGGQDAIIRVYDTETQKLSTKLLDKVEGHKNRVFAIKHNPLNPYVIYSGGWDCSILVHDLRDKKRVGDIFGPYICGESIAIKDDLLIAGSYSSDGYLKAYDIKTLTKVDDMKWDDSGRGGFVYTA